jgi:hypothetical protein
MRKPEEYKHVRAWGNMLHSDASYIKEQQEKAAKAGAPLDAIYYRDGVWSRFSEVNNRDTLWYFKMHYPELLSKDSA